MKLVREHIFEKFSEDSDAIQDMGIGITNILPNAAETIFDVDAKNLLLSTMEGRGNLNHIRININKFSFDYYSNTYRNWRGKPFNKTKYSTYLLKEAGILQCFEKNPEQGRYSNHGVQITFIIKDEFVKYFKQGWYDQMSYLSHRHTYYHNEEFYNE